MLATGEQSTRSRLCAPQSLTLFSGFTRDETAQILVKTLRYEDVRINTLNSVMDILSFLLPPEDLPTLEQVTCALDIDTSKDPYASRKSPIFAAWDHYDDETRAFVLEKAKPIWCKFGLVDSEVAILSSSIY